MNLDALLRDTEVLNRSGGTGREALGLQLTLSGSGIATQQDPAPGSKVPEGSKVQVAFARWVQ